MTGQLKKLKWACWNQVARLLARKYISGPELENALDAGRRFATARTASTIGYFDTAEESPEQVAAAALRAVEEIGKAQLDCYLSIKAPPLRFNHELVSRIAERARKHGVRLHFDSHSPEDADATFSAIAGILPLCSDAGCTLPGRWRRSLADADWAVEKRLHVRVVKGQWSDTEKPEVDLREGYLSVIDRLAGRARHVAVATHDEALAKEALARLRRKNTRCEWELLYGLPLKSARQAAQAAGVGVRIYCPYGHGYLPYCISQVYKRPQILAWMLRDLVRRRS